MFQIDLLVWGVSKRNSYRETTIRPGQLGLNFEAFQHWCIVTYYHRESSYETSRFKFGFWRASRVQRSLDLNDAHTLHPENTPGHKASTFPSDLSDCCCTITVSSNLTHSFYMSGWQPVRTGITILFCIWFAPFTKLTWTKSRMSKYYSNTGPCSQHPGVKERTRIYRPVSLTRVPCRLGRCVTKGRN